MVFFFLFTLELYNTNNNNNNNYNNNNYNNNNFKTYSGGKEPLVKLKNIWMIILKVNAIMQCICNFIIKMERTLHFYI